MSMTVNFTSITESVGLESLMQMLEEYYTVMSAFVTEHGGTVGDYLGDGIMSFWNSPDDVEDHAERALQAALKTVARQSFNYFFFIVLVLLLPFLGVLC